MDPRARSGHSCPIGHGHMFVNAPIRYAFSSIFITGYAVKTSAMEDDMSGPEDSYVKFPALTHSTRLGWRYMSIHGKRPGTDYDSETNIFLSLFSESLRRLNPDETVDEATVQAVLDHLRNDLSAEDVGRLFYRDLVGGVFGLRLVDFDHPGNNDFTVVTELPYEYEDDSFRPDIVFLLNGMPLAFMEVKRENNRDGILAERDRMHRRFGQPHYRRFANITQLMVFSNNQPYDDEDHEPIQGSFYACSAYGTVKMNHFREPQRSRARLLASLSPRDAGTEKSILRDNNGIALYGSPEWEASVDPRTPANEIITSMLSPKRFLFLLRYGICYREYVDDNGVNHIDKHIMRYPQLFATLAVRGKLDSGAKQGVIWHTQGSGKTELAFLLSRYLKDYYQRRDTQLQTFFIVDRLELLNQASDEFTYRGANVVRVESREEFAELLRKPSQMSGQNDAPVIAVVNIQKFSADALSVPPSYNINIQRLFFLDEAHRDYKPGHSFLSSLISADRQAVRIALTGTPLIRQKGGANTREVFGDYIHTYFYNQSVADGYTLKLLHEEVEQRFRVRMRKIVSDLRELDKLVTLDQVYEHPHYIDPLVEYIVDDLCHSRVEAGKGNGNIGAMVVATSSKQARAISEALQQYDPDVSSALVLYDEGTKNDRREIQKRFKQGEIDILVVYDMLLTGFDAPRLKKLYLCRKIKAHNLLQALTRVNRPYHGMTHGYVVDFADISAEFDKTNRAYYEELSKEYGDEADRFQSLFEDPEAIRGQLGWIKRVLWNYTTDNIVAFTREIGAIGSEHRDELYKLRKALRQYKELRNMAAAAGFEELRKRFSDADGWFDVDRHQKLLNEVELRIQRLNMQESLKSKELSTGAMNVLLDQMEFEFSHGDEAELEVSDKLREKLRKARGTFGGNKDPKDPAFVNLLDKLREKLAKADFEEMTTEQVTSLMDEVDHLRKEAEEINRRNDQLAGKYGGDAKFMRVHKEMKTADSPITTDDMAIHRILALGKKTIDSLLEQNAAAFDQEASFKRKVGGRLIRTVRDINPDDPVRQTERAVDWMYAEYSDERKNHLV